MQNAVKAAMTVGMLTLGIFAVNANKASAYTDALNANNTAQITITIRPNVDRSVTISTANVNLDLGSVDLTGGYVSTATVRPSTVTIGGTFGNTDLLLSANINGGWNFDSSSNTLETDKLATWVAFTSISSATAPSQDNEYFFGVTGAEANSGLIASNTNTYPATRVGTNAATLPGLFESNFTSMNGLAVNTQRHMWFNFRMPSDTSTTNDQRITFILTVDSGI
jgi:hypothetical protein